MEKNHILTNKLYLVFALRYVLDRDETHLILRLGKMVKKKIDVFYEHLHVIRETLQPRKRYVKPV